MESIENIGETIPVFKNIFDGLLQFFNYYWIKINNFNAISEIFIITTIVIASCYFQTTIKKRYVLDSDEENPLWYKRLLYLGISFTAPIFTFIFISIAMSISAGFTENLTLYKLTIKLCLIWGICIFIFHTMPDLFVRTVILCTLIPTFILSTFGLSIPLLNYLDTLGFPLGGVQISVFLILKGLLIGTCLLWFARLVCQNVIHFINSQQKITPELRDLMGNLVQVILYVAVFLITFDLIGIDLKTLAIVGGAIGIGIGLGLQKIAANFISGIIILFEQNIKVGHLVEIPGEKPGWIRHLGTRAAIVDMGNGRDLLIPNEELLTKTVIDWTAQNRKIRIDLQIKVSFKSNLEKAKKIMLDAVTNHPICSKSSPPSCFLEKFTDNGAQFVLLFWVDDLTIGQMDMQNDVLLTIWKRFGEENIEHPTSPLL